MGHSATTFFCEVTADASYAISTSLDTTARVWDLARGTTKCVLTGHGTYVSGCAISADGGAAATASGDGCIRCWDTSTGNQAFQLRRHGMHDSFGCALTPDGATLVATFCAGSAFSDRSARRSEIVICDWLGSGVVAVWEKDINVYECSISQDANIIAFSWWDGQKRHGVDVIDAVSGATLNSWTTNGIAGLDMDCKGQQVVIADKSQLRICSVSQQGMQFSARDRFLPNYRGVETGSFCAIAPDASLVMAAVETDDFVVWDAKSGRQIGSLKGHTGDSRGCAVNANGTIITCSSDNTVRKWSLSSEQLEMSQRGQAKSTSSRSDDSSYDVLSSSEISNWVESAAPLSTSQIMQTFQGICSKPNDASICLVDARHALQSLLSRLGNGADVCLSNDQVDDMFFDVCEPGAVRVNKQTFVAMARGLEETVLMRKTSTMIEAWSAQFADAARPQKELASISAAVLIAKLKWSGSVHTAEEDDDQRKMFAVDIRNKLRQSSCGQSDMVSLEEFLVVARDILLAEGSTTTE